MKRSPLLAYCVLVVTKCDRGSAAARGVPGWDRARASPASRLIDAQCSRCCRDGHRQWPCGASRALRSRGALAVRGVVVRGWVLLPLAASVLAVSVGAFIGVGIVR